MTGTSIGFCVTDFGPFNSTRYYAEKMEPRYPQTETFPGLDTWAILTVLGKTVGFVQTTTTNLDYVVRTLRRHVDDEHKNPASTFQGTVNPYALLEGGDFDRVGEIGRPPRLVPAGTVRTWCENFGVPLVQAGPPDRMILCSLGDTHRKSLIVAAWGPML